MKLNSTNYMHPDLFRKYQDLLSIANHNGIYFIITQVGRLPEYQKVLYNQGRFPVDIVNRDRNKLGLPLLKPKENKIVTWTLKSKHLLKTYQDNKRYSLAFDVAIIKPNTKIILWDKPDINNNNRNDYMELGELGEKIGLIWGGRFKNPDMPHFEIAVPKIN